MNVKDTGSGLIFAVLNILISLRVVLEEVTKAQKGSGGIGLLFLWSAKFVEKIKTHNLFSIIFFPRQSYRL